MAARGRGRPRKAEPTNTPEAPEKGPVVITDIAIHPGGEEVTLNDAASIPPQDAIEREMARMMAERQAMADAVVPVDDDGNPDPNHTGNYYNDRDMGDTGIDQRWEEIDGANPEEEPGDYHWYTFDETIELVTDAPRGTAASWRTQAKEEDIKGAANQALIARLNWGATQFEEFAGVVSMLAPGYTVEEVPEVAASEE